MAHNHDMVVIMEPDEKPKAKMGRPTKFDQSMRDKIMYLTGGGKTDEEVANEIGVATSTYYLWKKNLGPNFSEALKSAKEIADDMVEMSLLDNAVNSKNVVAQIFWLKNRRPAKWRDKIDLAVEEIDEMEF